MSGYSNSKLATVKALSPNHSGRRVYPITRISIHCTACQVTARRLGEVFANPNKEASSNYGVGYDGSIGMYVEEKNRSWCTSSYDNDNRAITIEVASENTRPYTVTKAAYVGLIKLLVDICKRNGKTKLVWFGDRAKSLSYKPKSNELVMTVHKWFANKDCPGSYLLNLHPQIVREVNEALAKKEETKPVTPAKKEEAKYYVYKVVKGDTLSKIAKNNFTTVAKIKEINKLADPNKIVVGQKINLPMSGSSATFKKIFTVVPKKGLNIRKTASTGAVVVAMSEGDKCTGTGNWTRNSTSIWIEVKYVKSGKTYKGYAYKGYLK